MYTRVYPMSELEIERIFVPWCYNKGQLWWLPEKSGDNIAVERGLCACSLRRQQHRSPVTCGLADDGDGGGDSGKEEVVAWWRRLLQGEKKVVGGEEERDRD